MRSKTSERELVRVNCPHINKIVKKDSPLAKIESSSFKKQIANSSLHCDNCEARVPRLWICLHSRCRAVVCASSKSHMRNHFDKENREDACHSVFVNPHTLKIWCVACGSELNPFENNGLISEARNYLKTVIRCLQVKRNKSQQSIDQLTIDVPGLVGLKNLGNTCYANAALQCLSNTPALTDFFNYCDAYIPHLPHLPHTSKRPPYKLAEYFNQFVKAMWNGTSAIFTPIQLMNEIKKHNNAFQGYGQEDSVDFLRVVLNRLHEELPYPQNMPGKVSKNGDTFYIYKNPSISTSNSSDNMEDNHYVYGTISSSSSTTTRTSTTDRIQERQSTHNSVISYLFQGLFESQIKCLHCKKDYLKEEHFYDLQIQIDKKFKFKSSEKFTENSTSSSGSVMGSLTGWLGMSSRVVRLQDCLSSFCATENLTGGDKYRCDKCESLNDCQKKLSIMQLPETLCIQLKRFRHETYFSSKIATHVQFPMEDLDMRPYCKDLSNDTLKITKYDLYGLIHHRGGLGGGHYIAYVKNPIDKNWYEYDDTYVTRKSAADISRLEAYVLFYQKKSPEKDVERAEVLSKIDKDSTAEPSYFISRLWFNRWHFMTTPGPITNYDFICPHGCVNTKRYPRLRDMVVKVPFSIYNTFVNKYGTDGSLPLFSADHTSGCIHCEREERKLEQRRRKEDDDVRKIDTNSINRGEYWFLISATWLLNWHYFKSGGPPPGPIDNYHFLHEDGSPKHGMKRGSDYRGVNEKVWSYFEHTYGGGPICVRGTIDLYAPNPLISDHTKHGKFYQKSNGSKNNKRVS